MYNGLRGQEIEGPVATNDYHFTTTGVNVVSGKVIVGI